MSFWGRNWWVFAVCVVAVAIHVHFSKEKSQALQALNTRLSQMHAERLEMIRFQEDLRLQIASKDDPAWIEMVLIRELGVVPEGFLKVHFEGITRL